MADEEYGHPLLAALYDWLYPDRSDLDAYVDVVEEFNARRVLDIGCGTGSFALLLADRGIDVIGIEPARASIDVAKAKPGSWRVRWVCGDVTALPSLHPPPQVDLATMTANVAPAIADPHTWQQTLRSVYDTLRPGGRLVFETRNPAQRAWKAWNRDASYRVTQVPGVGPVETWADVLDVRGSLVTVRWTYAFATDDVLTSTSTLRFPEREEVEAELTAQEYVVKEVRDAPDRPGRELVFIALRPEWPGGDDAPRTAMPS